MMVEDWEYSFPAPPLAAVPSEVFASEKTLSLNRSTLHLKYYGPTQTDSDISAAFHLLCAVDSPGIGGPKPRAAANSRRQAVGLRIRVIVVRPPERREVPAEVQFEVARDTVTDTADLGTARLRTGQGQG